MKNITEKELDYIKYVLISGDLNDSKTSECLVWWTKLVRNVFGKKASEEEILQYNRIRDIENFMTLLAENVPSTTYEYLEKEGIFDSKEKEFAVKVMMEKATQSMEDALNLSYLKQVLEEEYEQDVDEPFIQDLIKELHGEYLQDSKYERVYEIIENVSFETLDDEMLFGLLLLLFNELTNKKNNKMLLSVKFIDKKLLLYLIFKCSEKFSIQYKNKKK